LLGSLLYGVSAADPVAIGATCLISIVVAALACCVPAMRAMRTDPMTALRTD
jgi:ABC-type lipoprotein release transport system permease subunit